MVSFSKFFTITSVVFSILLSFSCTLYSFTQVGSHDQLGNGTTAAINTDFCSEQATMLPTRFTFESDETHIISCRWDIHNQGVRISYSLGGAIFSIASLVFIFKQRKGWFIFHSLIVFALGGCGVYSFIIDVNAVWSSSIWCQAGMDGAIAYQVECLYSPFIITIILSVFASIFLILSPILIIVYRNVIKSHYHYEPIEEGHVQHNRNGYEQIEEQEDDHHNHHYEQIEEEYDYEPIEEEDSGG